MQDRAPSPTSAVAQSLAPEGALAQVIPFYEDRPGQRAMAAAVARAIADNQPLMVEAGTGVGKTLAYLVPALQSGKKVVVSTGTKTLQEQIARNDVPLLRSFLARPFAAVVLKGVANYACLRRLAEAEARNPLAIAPLAPWLTTTETGDRAEVEWLAENDPIWPEVTTTTESRIGPRCPFFERCFVTQARRAAEKANLIIVNHHLYFADLALRTSTKTGKLLPPHDVVIFDEAHQLEDVATEHFSVTISTHRIAGLVRDASNALNQMPLWTGGASGGDACIRNVERAAVALFAVVRGQLAAVTHTATATPGRNSHDRLPLPAGLFDGERRDAWFTLDSSLEELARSAEAESESHPDESTDEASARGALDTVARRARELRDDLAIIAEQQKSSYVYWGEARPTGTTLAASPIEVGDLVRRHIVQGNATAIFTSATLTVGGDFAYTRRRLGLRPEEVEATVVASPFDYGEQAVLYVPRDLAPPALDGVQTDALARTTDLLRLTNGRAMILCTSLRAVEDFANHVRKLGDEFAPLVAGTAPRATLLERFRFTPRAVLIGAAAFWEGVDIAGDQLSLVIIDRLPFSPPAEPLYAARASNIVARNGDPFAALALPAAAIALRQGFGRLIRRRDDRGIVAVLDSRIVSKSYGRVFFNALPQELRRTSAFEQIRQFWLRPGPGQSATHAPHTAP